MVALLAAAVCAAGALAAGAPAAKAATPVPPSQDPFYTYSGSTPLSQIAPGTVLNRRAISGITVEGANIPFTAEQLLYRTTGEQGQATATVTTIIKPVTSAVGTKIVAYQTAYDALTSGCDPSYSLQGGDSGDSTAQAEATAIAAYVTAGFTVTVPDYEGESLDWGAGQESGYGTLDAIRATESYLGVPRSTQAGMLGYSGGSIATEWASELAPTYAPKLNFVGAAIGGVPVDFAHNLTYINGDQDWAGVIPAVLVSVGRAFGVDISQYLSAYGTQVTSQVSDECIGSFASAYPGLTIQQLLLPQYSDPFQIKPLVDVMNHLIMGNSPGKPGEPLLIGGGNADGTGDGIMLIGDEEALAHEYCQRGVPVTFQDYEGLPHADAAVPWEAAALTFLEARFAGLPEPGDCALIPPGNSLAPLPEPAS